MTDAPLLDFLFQKNGKLSRKAKVLPELRDYVQNLPEVKGTFRRREIDGIPVDHLNSVFMEFVKTWPVPDSYGEGKRNSRWVNPNHVHANRYSDIAVECDCGAKFTRNYEDDGNALRNEHEHTDDCQPYHRLRARAEMAEKRHNELRRLILLGWRGTDIAPRLGVHPNRIGGLCNEYGFTVMGLRKEYQRRVANSYQYAMCELDMNSTEIAAICGHDGSTLAKWVDEYGDYEEPGDMELQRDTDGTFRWVEA